MMNTMGKIFLTMSAVMALSVTRAFAYISAPSDSVLRFAFITDSHIARNTGAIDDLSACLRDINSQNSLDFVLFGGDITDFGTDEEIGIAKSMMDTLKLPYHVVQGNHDANWSESGCNTFLKVFGYERFSFKAGGWRFIGCNSGPDMRMAPGLVPKETMDWLDSLKNEGRCIFINHYPMDSSVLNWFDVTRQLKRLGVRFEIGGHWHQNIVMNYDGIPAVLCRSSLSAGKVPGYTIVRLDDKHISFSERRIYGDTAVEFEPWYSYEFPEQMPADTIRYDADGLPDNYPWMRYDVNRRYQQARTVWKTSFEANIVAGFAVKEDKAFFPLASGTVKCISLKDGREVWSRDFGGKIFSTPAVSGKVLVFGCTDGNIYAVRTSDGSEIWRYRTEKSVLASPMIMDGIVYIGGSDHAFRALDVKTGKAVWTYSGVEGHMISTAYVDKDRVVFGTWGRKLYSLDPETGREQWVWTVNKGSRMYSPAHCVPVCGSGRIFVAVPDRRIYAIDASSGHELFHVDGGRDALCVSGDGTTVFSKVMFGKAYAFASDASVPERKGTLPEGDKLWEVRDSLGYDIGTSALTEKDGVLLIPSDKGNIVALDASDGHFLWAHKVSLALVNPLKVIDRKGRMLILASSMDGTVELIRVDQRLGR